jgi:sialic acid synthase SpsE
MAFIQISKERSIKDYGEPYFVAELNTSHFGNIQTAKNMIDQAKIAGCDCVKFQSWSESSLYTKDYYKENPIAKRFFKKFSLSAKELLELVAYCQNVGISFASTPYSKSEVDFLVENCDVPFIKIASMDLNNLPLLEFIGSASKPIVLSTGMGTIDEVKRAVEVLNNAGTYDICILHCVAVYPPKIEMLQLNNILGLRKSFSNYPIGYSDHSIGIEMACAAVALGASLIEKHFTLDKTKLGMDNQMATEPDEMKNLIKSCKNIYSALGSQDRKLSKIEYDQRVKMRRSIVSSRVIKMGDFITRKDLDLKRPGTGISPVEIESLIGRRVAKDIEIDEIIKMDDLV